MQSIPILEEKIAIAEFGGITVEMLLNSYAVNLINVKYGGIEKIGEVLSKDSPTIYEDTVYLLTALANGAVVYRNLGHYQGDDTKKKPLYDNDFFLAVLMPSDIVALSDPIITAINKGYQRQIESESSAKNAQSE